MEKELLAYLEYQFVSRNHAELNQGLAQVREQLKKDRFSARLLQLRDDITNDIKLLTPLVEKNGYELLKALEQKYEIKFKFLTPKSSLKVNGS